MKIFNNNFSSINANIREYSLMKARTSKWLDRAFNFWVIVSVCNCRKGLHIFYFKRLQEQRNRRLKNITQIFFEQLTPKTEGILTHNNYVSRKIIVSTSYFFEQRKWGFSFRIIVQCSFCRRQLFFPFVFLNICKVS